MAGRSLEELTRDELLAEVRALRRSEAKFSRIISVSADAIILVDDDQKITLYNEGAERIFGWSQAEAMGAPLEMLIPERYRAAHRRHIEAFARGPVTARRMGERSAEIVGLRKSGQEFPADAAISKVEMEGQRLLTVALRDITDRKRAEIQQRFLAELSSEVASVRLDFRETLVSIGRLIARDLADCCVVDIVAEGGYPRRLSVLHRDPDKAAACGVLARDDLEMPAFVSTALRQQQPMLLEVTPELIREIAHTDEQLHALREIEARSVMVLPLVAHGQVFGALGLVSSHPDCPYESRDRAFYEDVARRAALAVDNAHLYERAREETRQRERMTAVVTHDLRNPLSAIRMHAELLLRHGPIERSAAAIKRSADSMLHLISDLLDATAVEAGTLPLARQSVLARFLVRDALAELAAAAEPEAQRVEARVTDEDFAVYCDRGRMLQTLSSLLASALTITSHGIVSLRVERDGHEARFSVEGIRPGVPTAQLPHLFDRYAQTAEHRRPGGGLRLSIARGIIEQHGGRLWAESEVSAGTSFHFTLPIDERLGDRVSPQPFV